MTDRLKEVHQEIASIYTKDPILHPKKMVVYLSKLYLLSQVTIVTSLWSSSLMVSHWWHRRSTILTVYRGHYPYPVASASISLVCNELGIEALP
jgi:hypothetical protein